MDISGTRSLPGGGYVQGGVGMSRGVHTHPLLGHGNSGGEYPPPAPRHRTWGVSTNPLPHTWDLGFNRIRSPSGWYTSCWNSFLLLPANKVCKGYAFTGVCLSTGGGHAWSGGIHDRGGHVWQGDGMHGRGGLVWQEGVYGRGCIAGGHVWQGGGMHDRNGKWAMKAMPFSHSVYLGWIYFEGKANRITLLFCDVSSSLDV